ncbi:MAG: DUF1579 domain-containing protein [Deltaproteobacteria bacterium]|nr:DUF1579 domain-containing protein [Deltaproteobacteria bacterium]
MPHMSSPTYRCPSLFGTLGGLLFAALLALLLAFPAHGEEGEKTISTDQLAAMMEKARTITQPSEHHQALKRFLGTWETALSITMGGGRSPAEKGETTFSWLIDGRWVQGKGKGTLMGLPSETFMLLGYDNFKKSYVTASVSNMDTAMITSEGDMDPGGKALLTYGTLDEYLTGEHDKMVKTIWRFLSEDEILMELHDLPIGENHTQVVEIRFKRKKGSPS